MENRGNGSVYIYLLNYFLLNMSKPGGFDWWFPTDEYKESAETQDPEDTREISRESKKMKKETGNVETVKAQGMWTSKENVLKYMEKC